MFVWIRTMQVAQLKQTLAALVADAFKGAESELSGIRTVSDLSAKVKQLREQVEKLEVEKGRKEEEFARKEREIEHKVGLHRKQTDFEIKSGKEEAVLKVREENLAADRKRFEEQMKFQNDRFTQEVGYLKDMLGQMMKRLPSAEIVAEFSNGAK